ncbi:hypothetical protein AGMMS49938_04490 [Fibrobacterales bacterium]|nr:hypothetical protein AGMMS49938_04490 [Fibrobacterales bacterium]
MTTATMNRPSRVGARPPRVTSDRRLPIDGFKKTMQEMQAWAKEVGLTPQDVQDAIKQVRVEAREVYIHRKRRQRFIGAERIRRSKDNDG